MAKQDYYETLGVARGAGEAEIKRAYRQKAKELHPDRNPESRGRAEEEFKRFAEAYEVLSDPQKRSQYDRYGHTGPDQGFTFGGTDFRRAREAYREFGFGGVDDIFDLFFRQGGIRSRPQQQRSRRGESIEYKLRITLEDAARGTKMTVPCPASWHAMSVPEAGWNRAARSDLARRAKGTVSWSTASRAFWEALSTCAAVRNAAAPGSSSSSLVAGAGAPVG